MRTNQVLCLAICVILIMSAIALVGWNLSRLNSPDPQLDPQIYRDLISRLKLEGYSILTAREFLASNLSKLAVIVHDTDNSFEGAKVLVSIEREFNIRSSFYLRPSRNYFLQSIRFFQGLERENWEIGFHYSSLSRADGNQEFARETFTAHLFFLRHFFNISTVRGHGDGYNLTILNRLDSAFLESLNVSSLEVKEHNVTYIRDTGKKVDIPSKWSDRVLVNFHSDCW